MKTCVVYANCQGDGLKKFLPMLGFPYEIIVYRNYQMILGEQKWEDLIRDAKQAEIFIYQPVEKRHEKFSTDFVLDEIPGSVRRLSFAYVYNHGVHPLTEHGGKFPGAHRIDANYWQMPKGHVLALYDQGAFHFNLRARFLESLEEQARREQACDLKLTGWMRQNRHRRMLLNVNHPATNLFWELSVRVMDALGLPKKIEKMPNLPENVVGLPCTLPLSKYVIDAYSMTRSPDPPAHHYYRNLLGQLWESKQR